MSVRRFKNLILQSLEADAIARLELHPAALEREQEIATPGGTIRKVSFIEDGIGSMSTSFADGSEVQVALFGCESVIGASGLMGTTVNLNRVFMLVAGSGYECPLAKAAEEYRLGAQFHGLVLRYVQAQLTQTAQSAACNARHNILERLSKWLLMCADRAEGEVIEMTQQSLASVLGTGRPGVSLAAEELQRKSVIEYRRGKVRILDRERLERLSCECYQVLREHLGDYTKQQSGFGI